MIDLVQNITILVVVLIGIWNTRLQISATKAVMRNSARIHELEKRVMKIGGYDTQWFVGGENE